MNGSTILFLTGDRFETGRSYRSVREKFFGADPEEIVNVQDCDRAHAEIMFGSLFGTKRLVHLDSSLYDTEWNELIIGIAPRIDGTRLMVIRDVEKSLDRRKLSKLKKIPNVLFWHFDELKNQRESVLFIQELCREAGIESDRDAAELLAAMVGDNRGLIASELEKLALPGKRLTRRYVAACAFPSSHDAAHFVLYMAIADGKEVEIREQTSMMMSDGIPPLVIIASVVKLLSSAVAGNGYAVERNERNESWMGTEKGKSETPFMSNIYRRTFERIGERRILTAIAESTDSLAALRLSSDPDMEKTRVDRMIGAICQE